VRGRVQGGPHEARHFRLGNLLQPRRRQEILDRGEPADFNKFLEEVVDRKGARSKMPSLFLRFRALQPGIRCNSFYGKHLYEVVRDAEIPPQLSATQGFRVILAN
jgi:hypothetical protein